MKDWTKVTKDEFLAELRAVGEDLRAGRIPEDVKLDMGVIMERVGCGTACCIGGWVEHRLGVPYTRQGALMDRFGKGEVRLTHLFYVFPHDRTNDRLAAADAIDAYFAGGDGSPWYS